MKIKTTFQLDPVDIDQTYSGKDGCACGCAGSYAESDSVATKKRLAKINQNLDKCRIDDLPDYFIFELITKHSDDYSDGRVIRAYVQKSKLYGYELEAVKSFILEKEGN